MTRAKEKFHPLLSWEVLFRSSFQEWVKDRATRFSAALAYYSIFAMAPLVTIAISIAGLAFGAEAARGQVYDQVHYLGRSSIGSSFGAAGALILVLVWVYYSAMVFFLGAEFTKVYADRYGSGINPGRHCASGQSSPTCER